jgi:hypothetical protein
MTNTAIDFDRKPTADMEPEFWAYWGFDYYGTELWTLVFVEEIRGGQARFEKEGVMARVDLDELRLPKLVCEECGEPAVEQPPADPRYATQRYSHSPGGEPLCPTIGPDGYEPCRAV